MIYRSLVCVFAMAFVASAACAQTPWKPERNVEILIASTAGTGPNRLARMIQRLWSEQKDMNFTTSVVTRPGGGGTILWSYMNQRRGDPHHLANSYLGAADLRKYLDRQYGEVRQVLTDLGMAKAPAD